MEAYQPKTLKPIWKAEISSDTQMGFSSMTNKSAKLIVKTMKEDGLFE